MSERERRERLPWFDWPPLWRDPLPPDWEGMQPDDIADRAVLIGEHIELSDCFLGRVHVGRAYMHEKHCACPPCHTREAGQEAERHAVGSAWVAAISARGKRRDRARIVRAGSHGHEGNAA